MNNHMNYVPQKVKVKCCDLKGASEDEEIHNYYSKFCDDKKHFNT